MAPTILVAGATGNTGRSTVETLSRLLEANSNTLSGHRILALTRDLHSPAAQQLATFPGIELVEKNWVDITANWLREHQIVRAFIAPHYQPNQFAEESKFHLAALQAGVQYVVRISTTAANVRPDCPAYHGRSHWAIEALLDSPEFRPLQWTSLQPNGFTAFFLAPAAEFIKQYRRTGKQDTLRLVAAQDVPVAVIDAHDVGVVAAHLLCEQDPSAHNRAKYVLNGPEDITGELVVRMVEEHIGTRVEDVRYKDMSWVDNLPVATQDSKSVILSIKHAPETTWEGKCTASTTSKQVLEIAAPTRTPAGVLNAMLE